MDDKLLDDTYQQTFEGVVKNDLTIRRLKRVHTLSKLRCLASNNNLTRAVETSVTLKMLCKNIWVQKAPKKVIDVPWKIENFFAIQNFGIWQGRRKVSLLLKSRILVPNPEQQNNKAFVFVSHRTLCLQRFMIEKWTFMQKSALIFFFISIKRENS